MSWLRGISMRMNKQRSDSKPASTFTSGEASKTSRVSALAAPFGGLMSVRKTAAGFRNVNTHAKNSSSLYISNLQQKSNGCCLLLVDPQNDFVTGSLKVDGAVEDCERIAEFIYENIKRLQEVYVTMDTHMNYHIAHPMFWKEKPEPFTQITHQDIVDRKFCPVDMRLCEWVKFYTKELEKSRRFILTIWPPHCLIGTHGHNVVPVISAALTKWELENNKAVHYIFKGNNSKTEHYSALKAEVVVPEDKATQFNKNLFNDLNSHSKIYVAGEAKSHCVNFTVVDLVEKFEKLGIVPRNKLVLLDGGMSSVGGFEAMGNEFWSNMKAKGIVTREIEGCKVEEANDNVKGNSYQQLSYQSHSNSSSTNLDSSPETDKEAKRMLHVVKSGSNSSEEDKVSAKLRREHDHHEVVSRKEV